jgi:hypothetical protein
MGEYFLEMFRLIADDEYHRQEDRKEGHSKFL